MTAVRLIWGKERLIGRGWTSPKGGAADHVARWQEVGAWYDGQLELASLWIRSDVDDAVGGDHRIVVDDAQRGTDLKQAMGHRHV